MQPCCVSWWGSNSHLPEATEALGVLLDLKANTEDYKITHYIHLCLFLSLTGQNYSLVPATSNVQKCYFVHIVLMDDGFLEKPLCAVQRKFTVKKLHSSEYRNDSH